MSDQHFVVLHFQPPLHSVATIRWLLLKFVKSLNHHNKLNVYSQVASWQRWFWVILGFDSRFSFGFSAFPHWDVIIIIALTSLLHLFCAWKQAVRALLQLFLLVLFSFVTILTQNLTKWPVSLNLSDRKSHLNNRKHYRDSFCNSEIWWSTSSELQIGTSSTAACSLVSPMSSCGMSL